MKTTTASFEIKDVGAHLHVPPDRAPAVGSGAIIKIGKHAVPATLRLVQKLKHSNDPKHPHQVGLWYFTVKGVQVDGKSGGRILMDARGKTASITYPVTLTAEQLGEKKPKQKAPKQPKQKAKKPSLTDGHVTEAGKRMKARYEQAQAEAKGEKASKK